MLWNLGKATPTMTYVQEKCPVAYCYDGKTVETVDGHLCRVMELEGIDYTGKSDDSIETLLNLRRQFFESVGLGIVPTVYTHRYKLSKVLEAEDHEDPISNEICDRWSKNFSSTFRNRHCISYRTKSARLIDRAANSIVGDNETYQARIKRLDDIVLKTQSTLKDYQPHLLTGEGLASFWSTLVNGKITQTAMPADGNLSDAICSTDLFWPSDRKNVQIFEGSTDRFSTWITLKVYDEESEDEGVSSLVFSDLFTLNQEFVLSQTFSLIDKAQAVSRVRQQRDRMKGDDNEDIALKIRQLDQLIQELENDSIKLVKFSFALQLFADSEEELTRAAADVQAVIAKHRFNSRRERSMSEALFWSMFPGYEQELNPRIREITTSNLACHINFSSIGEGLHSCDWGDMPLMPFLTETGSEYSFCFHESSAKTALGHTAIFGGSSVGKTTLMLMMMTHARKFHGMRQIVLDQLRGTEIAIRIQGGSYTSFDHAPDINPLQLPDNAKNRQFLIEWFKILSRMDNNESLAIIQQAINQNYELYNHERNLKNLEIKFGLDSSGSFLNAMNRWLPEGANGSYFNGKVDSLRFDKSLAAFDMTQIVKTPEILAPMTEYLYHCIESSAIDKPSPFILWTDEYRNYLNDPILGPKQVKAKAEYRKLRGVCVDLAQSPSHIVGDHKNPNKNGIDSLASYATFIFFPDASADFAILHEHFNINQTEYNWIRDTSNFRKVLVKRKSGSSTILNVDLSCLGNLLKAYSSSIDDVARMHQLRKAHPSDWAERYLRG